MTKTIQNSEYKKIIKKIKQARIETGFTQKEVSNKINKPQSYISKVEAGEQRIDVMELKALADLYQKSVDFFIK